VLVDVAPGTALLDPAAAEAAITNRTAAITVVDLYGQMVDVRRFRALADRYGLLLVEDAAQAHGARFGPVTAGSAGRLGAFSFFPGKNLGAMGDAGAITTDDSEVADRARRLRDHGRSDKHRHEQLGTNARLDTLQAAILTVKLRRLDAWNARRRSLAAGYDQAFAPLEGVAPIAVPSPAHHVYHQYVVRLADRDRALAHLRERGIATGVHYPVPLHHQPALAAYASDTACPHAERLAGEVLSLPVHPHLSDDDQARVIEAVAEYVGALAPAETPR
jgi:dTDP-4-amino-4,6-dideoxygalactose transaminase